MGVDYRTIAIQFHASRSVKPTQSFVHSGINNLWSTTPKTRMHRSLSPAFIYSADSWRAAPATGSGVMYDGQVESLAERWRRISWWCGEWRLSWLWRLGHHVWCWDAWVDTLVTVSDWKVARNNVYVSMILNAIQNARSQSIRRACPYVTFYRHWSVIASTAARLPPGFCSCVVARYSCLMLYQVVVTSTIQLGHTDIVQKEAFSVYFWTCLRISSCLHSRW